MQTKTILGEKLHESVASVVPIALIVASLCLFFVPISTDLMLAFVIAVLFLIVGMGLFTLGTEASMTPIGNYLGSRMTKTRNLALIIILSFVLGVAITIAEPDLQVLAINVPHINTYVLMLTVSVGVGFFLVVSMIRILLGVDLKWLLIVFYAIVFAVAAFSDRDFLSVAFDSGAGNYRAYDSPVHHGTGCWRGQYPQRQKCWKRQFRPGGPLLHRSDNSRPTPLALSMKATHLISALKL